MIYIIEADTGDKKVYKVGYTKNPVKHRLNALQTSNPFPLKVITTFDGDLRLEKYLHGYLDNLRLNGEWYNDGPLIQDIIKRGYFKSMFHPDMPRSPFSIDGNRAL